MLQSKLLLSGLVAAAALGSASTGYGVVLYDFESGIGGVSNGAGFGFASSSVAWENSGIGATSGTGSLRATDADGGGTFAWVAVINVNATPANVAAFAAASANPSNYTLEFDVTTHASTMPDWTNFVNGFVVINSQNGSFDQSTATTWNFSGTDTWGTQHASVSFADLENANAAAHGGNWFELGFSLNGDWPSASAGSIYIDNIQLNAVPEPASVALMGLSGLALLARRRHA